MMTDTKCLEDGQYYWVRPNADELFEPALYKDGAWWFIGLCEGAESVEEVGEAIETEKK